MQRFASKTGRGLEGALITTKNIPLPDSVKLTGDDLREFFVPSAMREMLPNGAIFIDARSTEIEAIPAGIVEFSMRGERAGNIVEMRIWALNFILGTTFVQIQFTVGGPAGSQADVARRMALFMPLFRLMANSIVFPDNWAADRTEAGPLDVNGLRPLNTTRSPPAPDPPVAGSRFRPIPEPDISFGLDDPPAFLDARNDFAGAVDQMRQRQVEAEAERRGGSVDTVLVERANARKRAEREELLKWIAVGLGTAFVAGLMWVAVKKFSAMWRRREKPFRAWFFGTVCWAIGTFLFVWLIDPYNLGSLPEFGDEEFSNLIGAMLVPPLFSGFVWFGYKKWVE